MSKSEPKIDERCLSDLALDRIVAGAPRTEHLSACARCQARLESFEDAQRAAKVSVSRLIARAQAEAQEPTPERWWRTGPFRSLMAAFAVAALLFVVIPRKPPPPVPGVRAKGHGLRFVVQRDGRQVPGVSGARFLPDDALRFLVTASAPGYLFLVGVEARSGKISAYHPFGGAQSARLKVGADMPLPGSLVLDRSSDDEFFLAVFSDEALRFDRIKRAIEGTRGSEGYSLDSLQQLSLPGEHHWIVVKKGD